MYRILVADDKSSSRVLLRTVLEADGHHVSEASDGAEALRQIRADRPHLVLLDLYMPLMDGFEVAHAVAADASLSRVPLVALTASATNLDRDKAAKYGFAAYLTKPISLVELRSQVNRLLSTHNGK